MPAFALRTVAVSLVATVVLASSATSSTGASSAGATSAGTTSAGAPVPATGQQLLAWIADHRHNVALAATDGDEPITLNAHQHLPLASVYKVLLLVAYAERVAAGRLDPAQRVPISAIERWYLPGTDGGAHPDALAYWRGTGALQGSGTAATVSLDDVVTGMIRFSDNSAADYVLQRVGVSAAADVARRHGMRAQYPVEQKFGEFVAVHTVPAATWRALSPAARSVASLAVGAATSPAAASRLRPLTPEGEGAWLEHGDTQGTAADWQRLWSDIESGRGIPAAAEAIVLRHVGWQLEYPQITALFTRDGIKGGSYATIVNFTGYDVTHTGRTVSYALFLHDLPTAFAAAVAPAEVDFVRLLSLRPTFYDDVARTLDS